MISISSMPVCPSPDSVLLPPDQRNSPPPGGGTNSSFRLLGLSRTSLEVAASARKAELVPPPWGHRPKTCQTNQPRQLAWAARPTPVGVPGRHRPPGGAFRHTWTVLALSLPPMAPSDSPNRPPQDCRWPCVAQRKADQAPLGGAGGASGFRWGWGGLMPDLLPLRARGTAPRPIRPPPRPPAPPTPLGTPPRPPGRGAPRQKPSSVSGGGGGRGSRGAPGGSWHRPGRVPDREPGVVGSGLVSLGLQRPGGSTERPGGRREDRPTGRWSPGRAGGEGPPPRRRAPRRRRRSGPRRP